MFENLVGVGSLGVNDGRANSFQASADGEGYITAVMPPRVHPRDTVRPARMPA